MARNIVVALMVGGLVLSVGSPADAHSDGFSWGGGAAHCRKVSTPVRLASAPAGLTSEDSTWYRLDAELCWRGQLAGKTLQVTVPGFTYGPDYWDFPYQPEQYSYVRAAVAAGYATLNVDRMLTPVPPATAATIPAQAGMLRQLVDTLRAGRIAGTRFRRIIGVGHSMGAAMLLIAAADYRGLNGLILADFLHRTNPQAPQQLSLHRGPAQANPQFKRLPSGYLSTLPGVEHRLASFYEAATADPRVVMVDERTKRAGTLGEVQTVGVAQDPTYSNAITAPVLLVMGEKDFLMCDASSVGLSCANRAAVLDRERDLFTSSRSLDAYVLPRAGHDTNLHYGAARWFAASMAWADRHVGN